MNVTPEVLDWVRKAEDDRAAAWRLAEGDQRLPDQMGFFCQQAAEKYLKAVLIAAGQVPPRTHDLDVLVEMCALVDPAFEQLGPLVEGLTEFAVIFRYPGEWSDEEVAGHALTQAESVRALVLDKLGLTGGNRENVVEGS
jgi:HEPN domain-containing protein